MAEFLIQGATLEATSDKIREKLGVEKLSFKEDVGSDGIFNSGAVTVHYQEYVDYANYYGLNQDVYQDDVFIAYEFAEDNNGVLTPVIYKTDIYGEEPETPDYQDKHFYVGQATIDGVVYDKWRKIEEGSQDFDWGTTSEKYIYTNVIIDINEYSPTSFPDKIEEVYNAGYEAGANSVDSESVVGTWVFTNDIIELPSKNFEVQFSCNGNNYVIMEIVDGDALYYSVSAGDETQIAYSVPLAIGKGNGWDSEEYQTITITEQPADTEFITWLKANAEKQVLPTLTNPGTAADLLVGKQLIDGKGNIVEGIAKSYNEAVMDYAPLIIQAERTPSTLPSDYGSGSAYSWVDFNNETVGNITFNIDNVIQTSISGNDLGVATLTVTNNNLVCWATVYIAVSHTYALLDGSSSMEHKYYAIEVAPLATASQTIRGSGVGDHKWKCSLVYVKWSTTQTSTTSEASEE